MLLIMTEYIHSDILDILRFKNYKLVRLSREVCLEVAFVRNPIILSDTVVCVWAKS